MILTNFLPAQPDRSWQLAKQVGITHAICKCASGLKRLFAPDDLDALRTIKDRFTAEGNQNPAITTLTEYDPVALSEDKPEDVHGFFVNDQSRKILVNTDESFSKRGQDVLSHSGLKRFGEAEELVSVNWLLNDEQARPSLSDK